MRRLRRAAGALAAATVACAPAPPIRILDPTHGLSCAPERSGPSWPLSAGAYLGPDAERDSVSMRRAIARYASQTGRAPALVKIYYNFSDRFAPGTAAAGVLEAIDAADATPLVTLEPTAWAFDQSRLLPRIAGGEADAYIRARREELLQLPGADSIIIELAPEMNQQSGAPWQPRAADSVAAPGQYVAAWRHVVALFRERGPNRIRWLWSPSAGNHFTHHATGASSWNWMERYYPGDDVVDAVGVHAFNDAESQGAWVPFAELVDGEGADRAISTLVSLHGGKPIILGEFASSELPGSADAKGAWITNAYASMRACSHISAVVWFDVRKERDWRIGSSESSLRAYRAAVR